MKGQWKKGWQVAAMLLATAAFGAAQTTMSAPEAGSSANAHTMPPPGSVNYIEGQVSVNGQPLTSGALRSTVLQPNELIDTGAQGYAEVLLTPGAFLRIGHETEARMLNAGLADVRLEIVHGSALLEAAQLVKGPNMDVLMNGSTTKIDEKGLYAFNTGDRAVQVLDGKATVSEAAGQTTLKKGDQVLLASSKPLKKRDFDTKAMEDEPLYVWSKVRSEDEAQANIHVANSVEAYGGWYGPGWYWDPYWSFYAFVPAYGFLGGPFGWGFYAPGFAWAAPYYGFYHGFHGYRGAAVIHGGIGRGFHGGGFHGGGFHSGFAGGFHGGGGRR
jgi:hypothetical protein